MDKLDECKDGVFDGNPVKTATGLIETKKRESVVRVRVRALGSTLSTLGRIYMSRTSGTVLSNFSSLSAANLQSLAKLTQKLGSGNIVIKNGKLGIIQNGQIKKLQIKQASKDQQQQLTSATSTKLIYPSSKRVVLKPTQKPNSETSLAQLVSSNTSTSSTSEYSGAPKRMKLQNTSLSNLNSNIVNALNVLKDKQKKNLQTNKLMEKLNQIANQQNEVINLTKLDSPKKPDTVGLHV